MDVAHGIRLAREKAALTQEQAATKSGLSKSTIANYENGRRSPRIKELQRIAEAYNIDVESFFAIAQGMRS
jgi:transcriptional regulator with XRE-family HTH domain